MSYTQFTQRMNDDLISTESSTNESFVEDSILSSLKNELKVEYEQHYFYLLRKANSIRGTMFDEAFVPWDSFFLLLPLLLLNYPDLEKIDEIKQKALEHLKLHKNIYCGWSGYIYDQPTLVPLYGEILLLGLIGKEEGYEMINREEFYSYILKCKNNDGSFSSCPGGEPDLRSTFSAILISYVLNIVTPELTKNLIEFTVSCFNFDGGFGPLPNCESHGGYVYCGIGILNILDSLTVININKTIRWLADRQMSFPGGFNGRTNKLVDSCYCWWVGSPCRTISEKLKLNPFWNEKAISEFFFRTTQGKNGGFCDRPPSFSDSFHTLWGTSGAILSGNLEELNIKVHSLVPLPFESFEKIKNYFQNKPFIVNL